jgi:hypothetical protein
MNSELERMWKEAIVAQSETLSHHLPEGSEWNH